MSPEEMVKHLETVQADGKSAGVDGRDLVMDRYEAVPPSEKSRMVAQLVGQVYQVAPPEERTRLIECLLKPLGVLSLAAIANGIFANIRFHSDWPQRHVRPEDVQEVQPSDVIALVNSVQEVSLQSIDNLARLLHGSPAMAGSAAAAVLMTILLKRAKNRRADDLRLQNLSRQ